MHSTIPFIRRHSQHGQSLLQGCPCTHACQGPIQDSGNTNVPEDDWVTKKRGANLIAVDCPLGRGKGQLVLLQDPTTFAALNGGPYNPTTQQPPTYPTINARTSTADWEHLHAKTTESQQHYQTYKQCEHICVK